MIARNEVRADCYSGGERAWMVRGQELRAALLGPLLVRLARLRVSPDHVTLASLALGLAAAPLLALRPWAGLVALVLHVLLDGVDGPLARHLGVASRRGSFTDTIADQVVVTATTAALMTAGLVGVVPGTLYVFLYAVVVAFAMVRNALDVPYAWLVRPRFAVYAWIPIELHVWPGSLDGLVWLCAPLLGAKTLSGFVRLRRRL
ncbi:MAG: CDP-alcohol phosphatidyltransferase family protein [Planctomycetota bacterium]